LKEIIVMTADASIDPARFLSEQLDRASRTCCVRC